MLNQVDGWVGESESESGVSTYRVHLRIHVDRHNQHVVSNVTCMDGFGNLFISCTSISFSRVATSGTTRQLASISMISCSNVCGVTPSCLSLF
eukprot:m.27577 g.27577  ORF g.27577 m.27577 type:complete len:93 (-) comp15770_c0_seq2:1867-2145(-)